MTRWGFFWHLARRSFHGPLLVLEIGEASMAVVIHAASYFVPGIEHLLGILSLTLIVALFGTFFLGLFLAAYASNKEIEGLRLRDLAAADERHRKERGEVFYTSRSIEGRLVRRVDQLERFIREHKLKVPLAEE
jgi:hypothetical protein